MEQARDYCSQVLEAAGWQCSEQPFQASAPWLLSDNGKPSAKWAVPRPRQVAGVNLVATSHPGGWDEDTTLVLAHLDSVRISPGADDNASGVAVALEVAAQLAGRQHRCAIALVDLEELSMLGARALLRANPRPRQVINLESVGYFDSTPGSQRLPAGFGLVFPETARQMRNCDRRGDVLLGVHRANSLELATAWAGQAAAAGLGAVLLKDRRWNGAGQSITRWANPLAMDLDRSDHAPFWRAQVPALMITDTVVLRNPHYHRASDTPDTLNYPKMAQTLASLVGVLAA